MLRTFGDLDYTNNDNKHNDAMTHIYKIFYIYKINSEVLVWTKTTRMIL